MCVLCAQMVSSFHWSNASIQDNQERKKARLAKAKIINEILSFYGLSLKEWQSTKFILSDKKGQTELVDDLGDLWDKVNLLLGFKADVLDEALLGFLKHNG